MPSFYYVAPSEKCLRLAVDEVWESVIHFAYKSAFVFSSRLDPIDSIDYLKAASSYESDIAASKTPDHLVTS